MPLDNVSLGDTYYCRPQPILGADGQPRDPTATSVVVRVGGAATSAAPITAGASAALLSDAGYADGVVEVTCVLSGANGFAAGNKVFVDVLATVDGVILELEAGRCRIAVAGENIYQGATTVNTVLADMAARTNNKGLAGLIGVPDTTGHTIVTDVGGGGGLDDQETVDAIASLTPTAPPVAGSLVYALPNAAPGHRGGLGLAGMSQILEWAGTATAGAANSITLPPKRPWHRSHLVGAVIVTTGSTGSGQERVVQEYNPRTGTVTPDTNWTVTPDSTTQYQIWVAQSDSRQLASRAAENARGAWFAEEFNIGYAAGGGFGYPATWPAVVVSGDWLWGVRLGEDMCPYVFGVNPLTGQWRGDSLPVEFHSPVITSSRGACCIQVDHAGKQVVIGGANATQLCWARTAVAGDPSSFEIMPSPATWAHGGTPSCYRLAAGDVVPDGLIMVWAGDDESGNQNVTVGYTLAAESDTWSAPAYLLAGATAAYQAYCTSVMDRQGVLHIGFQWYGAGGRVGIYYMHRHLDGTWRNAADADLTAYLPLSAADMVTYCRVHDTGANVSWTPMVGFSPSGAVVELSWFEGTAAPYQLYTLRITGGVAGLPAAVTGATSNVVSSAAPIFWRETEAKCFMVVNVGGNDGVLYSGVGDLQMWTSTNAGVTFTRQNANVADRYLTGCWLTNSPVPVDRYWELYYDLLSRTDVISSRYYPAYMGCVAYIANDGPSTGAGSAPLGLTTDYHSALSLLAGDGGFLAPRWTQQRIADGVLGLAPTVTPSASALGWRVPDAAAGGPLGLPTMSQVVCSGTVLSATTTAIRLAIDSPWRDRLLAAGCVLELATGTGAGQWRPITAWNGLTGVATVSAFSPAPDATTTYRVIAPQGWSAQFAVYAEEQAIRGTMSWDQGIPFARALVGTYPSQYPSAAYYNGYTYWVMTDECVRPVVYARNADTGEVQGPIQATTQHWPDVSDVHGAWSILVDGEGYVHVFGGTHGREILCARTTVPEDISAWEDRPSPNAGGHSEYPCPCLIEDGNLMVMYMWFNTDAGIDEYAEACVISDDGGATWSAPTKLTSTAYPENPYHNVLQGADRTHVAWQRYYGGATPNRRNVYYMYRDNTGVWRNAAGDDLTAYLPLDEATQDTYCLVCDTAGGWSWVPGIDEDSTGKPHLVYFTGAATPYTLNHSRWAGTAWTTVAVGALGTAYQNNAVIRRDKDDLTFHVYCTAGGNAGEFLTQCGDLQYWKTANGGITWTRQRNIVDRATIGSLMILNPRIVYNWRAGAWWMETDIDPQYKLCSDFYLTFGALPAYDRPSGISAYGEYVFAYGDGGALRRKALNSNTGQRIDYISENILLPGDPMTLTAGERTAVADAHLVRLPRDVQDLAPAGSIAWAQAIASGKHKVVQGTVAGGQRTVTVHKRNADGTVGAVWGTFVENVAGADYVPTGLESS